MLGRGDGHCPARAVSPAAAPPSPQPALVQGAAPGQVWNFTFVMVEFYEVPVGPILQVVSVPLNGGPAFKYTNCISEITVCKNSFRVCSVFSSKLIKTLSKKGSIYTV